MRVERREGNEPGRSRGMAASCQRLDEACSSGRGQSFNGSHADLSAPCDGLFGSTEPIDIRSHPRRRAPRRARMLPPGIEARSGGLQRRRSPSRTCKLVRRVPGAYGSRTASSIAEQISIPQSATLICKTSSNASSTPYHGRYGRLERRSSGCACSPCNNFPKHPIVQANHVLRCDAALCPTMLLPDLASEERKGRRCFPR